MPGSKSLSFVSPKESNPRKSDPDGHEFPRISPAGRASKNSPRFCWAKLIFVRGAQTPSPLIRPAGPILGVVVRGKVKTSVIDSDRSNRIECFAVTFTAGSLPASTQTATASRPGFDFSPLTAPPKLKCVGRISGKGV
ncbi:hypothetical protein Tbd_0998 [Thiobacillus denitrificans ATCC 25259]|uniref:Uncharacterized protein n=1 Tax=Thiobacillus denitrificans (strain ATCC 25259 / T1) TaxID=292415 RepID=Q3SK43_THIDA|nr:hypothetical protein Tbd_0998 [Thiobacillus denitrificans ATCC 25259]